MNHRSVHEIQRLIYQDIIQLASRHGVYLIIPMMYIIDRATGETITAQILPKAEDPIR